jgi:hypothetical protein
MLWLRAHRVALTRPRGGRQQQRSRSLPPLPPACTRAPLVSSCVTPGAGGDRKKAAPCCVLVRSRLRPCRDRGWVPLSLRGLPARPERHAALLWCRLGAQEVPPSQSVTGQWRVDSWFVAEVVGSPLWRMVSQGSEEGGQRRTPQGLFAMLPLVCQSAREKAKDTHLV